jgi:hypothetical protein
MKKVDKEAKKRVMDFVEKINDDSNEVSWEKGDYKIKKKSEIKKGKKAKSSGARFELKVRKDLEKKGKIVDKWTNNVDLEKNEMIIAKRKYNPFSRVMTIGTGFPDFISIKHIHSGLYSVIGVEVKMNGILSKEEKEKCAWYLKNKVFSEIWIAKLVREGNKSKIAYEGFAEKYVKFGRNLI